MSKDDDAVKDEAVTPPAASAPETNQVTETQTVIQSDPIDWDEDDDKPKPKAEAEPKPTKPEEKPKAEPAKEEPKETEDKPEDKPEVEEIKQDKTEEVKEPSKADERKTQLNTEIRDLVAKRNALKTDVEKANAEAYAPETIDELKEKGLSETDAKVESLRQQMEMDKYNSQVTEAQLTIESEANRVISDFSIFNPESDNFDKELSDEAGALMRANLITDENTGQVIGSNVSPYQLYKTIARAAGVSAAKGQIAGQAAAEKMMANADVSTNAAPPAKPKDPLMDLLVDWDSN